MNQEMLIKAISKKTGINQKEVAKIFNATLEVIRESLVFGMNIKLRDICTFKIIELSKRTFKLPTGESSTKPARFSLRIKASKNLVSEIQNKTIYNGGKKS